MPAPLRILLVDDDPLIIESMRNTLEGDGHTVIAADGGQAGIDALADALARSETFAAVITDLGMPYIDGRRVAAAVKASSPSTPVILLTGWGQRLMDDNDIPPYVDRVLNKPPKLADLRRVLFEVANLKPGAPEPRSRTTTG
jgi:CheY-like chemotaxis protein